jgi:hypothetical protein
MGRGGHLVQMVTGVHQGRGVCLVQMATGVHLGRGVCLDPVAHRDKKESRDRQVGVQEYAV